MDVQILNLQGLSKFLSMSKELFATKKVVSGASASANGESGLVPAPTAGDQDKCLFGDGTYRKVASITVSDDTGYEELEG